MIDTCTIHSSLYRVIQALPAATTALSSGWRSTPRRASAAALDIASHAGERL